MFLGLSWIVQREFRFEFMKYYVRRFDLIALRATDMHTHTHTHIYCTNTHRRPTVSMGRPIVSRAPGSAIVSGHIQCMVLPARLPPQYLLLPKRVRSPTSSRANPNRPHKYNPRTYTYTHTTRTRQTLADENLTLRRPEIVPELLQVTDQVLGAGGAGRVLKGE